HLTRTTISAEVIQDPSPIATLPWIHDLRLHDHRIDFEVDSSRLGDALERLTPLGVRSLVSHPPTLEELFMRHYEEGEAGV
ncbi:MAG: hypothetical protein WAN34_13030, partial [Acidimicrobiia bacterium]